MRAPQDREAPESRALQHLSVFAFGDIALGHRGVFDKRGILSIAALREILRRVTEHAEVVTLPGSSPQRVVAGGSEAARRRVALAFVGGHSAHARYVAPLLDMLGLTGHLFVPVERIGLPGQMSLLDLESLRQIPGVRIGLDLSREVPHTSHRLAQRLRQASQTLSARVGHRPQFVWVRTVDPALPLAFLLGQHQYAGAIARDLHTHYRNRGRWMLAASEPSWCLRLGLPCL
ncbi:MAG: hypothetical protein KAY24_14610 [Candidatus Eisenbacteria sp.]|nr:hypothetical protein [Candidatus Eisenbacteria bacterium]